FVICPARAFPGVLARKRGETRHRAQRIRISASDSVRVLFCAPALNSRGTRIGLASPEAGIIVSGALCLTRLRPWAREVERFEVWKVSKPQQFRWFVSKNVLHHSSIVLMHDVSPSYDVNRAA